MQALGACVGEVVAHAAVEVQVDEAGDDVAARGVEGEAVGLVSAFLGDDLALDPNLAGRKAVPPKDKPAGDTAYALKFNIHNCSLS